MLLCRFARQQPSTVVQHTARRLRSSLSASSKPKPKFTLQKHGSQRRRPHIVHLHTPFSKPSGKDLTAVPPAALAPKDCSGYFERSVKAWCTSARTIGRFMRLGFAPDDIRPILNVYAELGSSGFFSTKEKQAQYFLSRLVDHTHSEPGARQAEAEITFSNIFFSWCRNPNDSRMLDDFASQAKINPKTLASLRFLAKVAQRRPAEEFPYARKIHRKVIMHVGPTNSGKTHHALRALAAARTGVYAGPLRLLAHEIWERLNLGQIVPLGVDEPPLHRGPLSRASAVLQDQDVAAEAQRFGNPKYARKTNMITGEEKKIVDDNAGLLSCTVEMLSPRVQYDVGVIDEIQLIGDSQRGFAWTAALLGLCAKEIHLCGEESAIPVVRALLKDTGDDLEVRRYERLTPLKVEDKSLEGDYSKVQKGDCVVAFSRAKIFEIKDEIERKSGLRCAVVYGKLPPEIRSEQAALFNDPNSEFDVIIGSDAIGMGLNLKIRRIIFDHVTKLDGYGRTIPLSVSQTKQIAGRAGRYGHTLAGEAPGGYTTTLHEKDLPFLQEALQQPFRPIPHAHIGATPDTFEHIISALPPDTSLEAVQMAHVLASNLPPIYRYSLPSRLADMCHFIDTKAKGKMTWLEKHTLFVSPIAYRDELCMQATEEMVRLHRDRMSVGIYEALHGFVFLDALGYMEREMEKCRMGEGGRLRKEGMLEALESFHKVLVYYMWMHFRYSVVYAEREKTEELKRRVEVALDWGLQQLGRKSAWETTWSNATRDKKVEMPPVGIEDGHQQQQQQHLSATRALMQQGKSSPSSSSPLLERKIEYNKKALVDAGLRKWDKAPDLSSLLGKYVGVAVDFKRKGGGGEAKRSSA